MKTLGLIYLFPLFFILLSSCTFNASLKNLDSQLGNDLTPTNLQKIFVDVTDITISEGSVAIINVAVNPARNEDTVIYITLDTSGSSYLRFNPIPTKVIIPAGSTSKSVVLNTIDDSLNQDQENWNFTITSDDPSIHADPGVLHITLNDNDGGNIPGSPASNGPKLLKEFNAYPTTVNKISALGKVFYVGTDASHGSELWVSDGTSIGTKLLKDVEPGSGSSGISNFTYSNSSPYVYFKATTASEGTELWRTDGTEQGTQIVKDLEPGFLSSDLIISLAKNDKIYFTAYTTLDGLELYVSDGTPAGTKMLHESVPGSEGLVDTSVFADGSDIYFSEYNHDTGIGKLFRTDGNPANNVMLVDATASGSSFFNVLKIHAVRNGYIYFSSYGGYGTEIYVTNGSNATTYLLKDIYPGGLSSYAWTEQEYILNNKQIIGFSWEGTGTSTGYYLSDGTPAGTTKVTQSVTMGNIFGIIGGNKLIFSACTNGYDCELYSSSGVNGDAVKLKDIFPGSTSGNANSGSPAFVARIGDKFFFTATNSTEGQELYVTDGTTSGTILLKDIYAGSVGSAPSNFVVYGNYLIFTAKSNIYGDEIWITDGTSAGTLLYYDLLPGATGSGSRNLALLNSNTLFFTAFNSQSRLASVFLTDLSNANTTGHAHAMVETLNSETKNIVGYNGLAYFDAMNSSSGNPLWVSNGTENGTTKIVDLYPNITCSDINYMTVFNDSLFFAASTEASGQELFISDGTTGGTNILKELAPGTTGAYMNYAFTKTDLGKMFFSANDSSVGLELFATDGTVAGTGLVKDLNVGANNSSPQGMVAIPGTNKVVFYTTNPYGFWISNGTSGGTTQITGLSSISSIGLAPKVTNSGAFIFYSEASTYKQRIYFVNAPSGTATHLNTTYTTDVVTGNAFLNPTSQILYYATTNSSSTVLNLWKSDGTVAGTSLLKNIPVSGNNFSVTFFGNLGSKSLFQYANSSSSPYVRELWITDGTAGGTNVVDSATNTVGISYTAGFEYNGYLYFTRYHATAGAELWKTDGTSANTTMVKDINSGSGDSGFVALGIYNGKLYFKANDGVHGTELWRTDGTLLGTELVADINPGLNNSNPAKFTVISGKLYFTAAKVLSGTEIWVYSE